MLLRKSEPEVRVDSWPGSQRRIFQVVGSWPAWKGLVQPQASLAVTIQLKGSAPAKGAVAGALANHFFKRGTEFTFCDWPRCGANRRGRRLAAPGAGALPVFYNMDAAKVFISMRNFSRFLFGPRVASFLRPESWV